MSVCNELVTRVCHWAHTFICIPLSTDLQTQQHPQGFKNRPSVMAYCERSPQIYVKCLSLTNWTWWKSHSRSCDTHSFILNYNIFLCHSNPRNYNFTPCLTTLTPHIFQTVLIIILTIILKYKYSVMLNWMFLFRQVHLSGLFLSRIVFLSDHPDTLCEPSAHSSMCQTKIVMFT